MKRIFEKQRFGILVVQKRSVKNGHKAWECLCDCGQIKIVFGKDLNSGNTKSCGCKQGWKAKQLPRGEAATRHLFRSYKAGAKRRGLEFSLTIDGFKEIMANACWYCGTNPKQAYKNSYTTKGKKYTSTPFIHNGIDRINNNQGYTVNNCTACCRTCNFLKQGLSVSDFLEKIKEVYVHRILELW